MKPGDLSKYRRIDDIRCKLNTGIRKNKITKPDLFRETEYEKQHKKRSKVIKMYETAISKL